MKQQYLVDKKPKTILKYTHSLFRMQYLLTVIDTKSKCYQLASFTSRILVMFVLSPELKQIVVFDNKRKKVLRRISSKIFIQQSG